MKNLIFSGLFSLIVLMLCSQQSIAQNSYAQEGWKAYEAQDYVKAVEYFSKHLNAFPKDAVTYHIRANIYQLYAEYHKALSDINNSIKYYSPKKDKENLAKAFHVRGQIYAQIEELDKALQDINSALKLFPKSTDFLLGRANLYFQKGDYDTAYKEYEKILKMDESVVQAYWGIGHCFYAQERYKQAIEQFTKALRLAPNYPAALDSRARTYML